MALFTRKTKKETAGKDVVAAPVAAAMGAHSLAHILTNPRITEKASLAMEGSVYVFDVSARANKNQVSQAVQGIYKVTPRKIAILNMKPKTTRNMRTGNSGTKGGGKKAYVYLNKGETIVVA